MVIGLSTLGSVMNEGERVRYLDNSQSLKLVSSCSMVAQQVPVLCYEGTKHNVSLSIP